MRHRRLAADDARSGKPGEAVRRLDGVLARLECSVTRTFEAGDHTVMIGEVRIAGYREGRPLVYFDSSYRSLKESE